MEYWEIIHGMELLCWNFHLQNDTDYVGIIRYRDTDSPRSSIWVNGSFRTVGFR